MVKILKHIIKTFKKIIHLIPINFRRYILISGTIGALEVLSVYFLTSIIGIFYLNSIAIITFVVTIANFTLNRKFNFKKQIKRNFTHQALLYFIVSIVGWIFVLLSTTFLVEFLHIVYILAFVSSNLVAFFIRFYLNKEITYKERK